MDWKGDGVDRGAIGELITLMGAKMKLDDDAECKLQVVVARKVLSSVTASGQSSVHVT
jgi:hypothetical protein